MPSSVATRPNPLQPLSGAVDNPSLQAEADRVLYDWAHRNEDAEEAGFDFEDRAGDGPRLLDRGEWELLRMAQETDPNELVHDRYVGCFR
jgi:hypothetical protein